MALAPDGTLLSFEPPLDILQTYPKKWQKDIQEAFTPPSWEISQNEEGEWQVSCNGAPVPTLATAPAEAWGELWPPKERS